MPTSDDRRAALVLLGLAILGIAVRVALSSGGAPGSVGYRFRGDPGPTRDSAATAAARLARPLVAGEIVDVDRASAAELTRLPRIGPGLAARIVAEREAGGPFGSLEGLERVSGLGAATRAAVRPFVTFSGRPRRPPPGPQPGTAPVAVNRATAQELDALPGIGPRLAAEIVADRARNGPYHTPADLLRVRGIGPYLLRRLEGRILIP